MWQRMLPPNAQGTKGSQSITFKRALLPVSRFLQVDPSDKTTAISSNSTKDWKPSLNSVAHRGHFNQIKEKTEKTIEESGIEFRPKRLILKQSILWCYRRHYYPLSVVLMP